jgi:hypothetical protein
VVLASIDLVPSITTKVLKPYILASNAVDPTQ